MKGLETCLQAIRFCPSWTGGKTRLYLQAHASDHCHRVCSLHPVRSESGPKHELCFGGPGRAWRQQQRLLRHGNASEDAGAARGFAGG